MEFLKIAPFKKIEIGTKQEILAVTFDLSSNKKFRFKMNQLKKRLKEILPQELTDYLKRN